MDLDWSPQDWKDFANLRNKYISEQIVITNKLLKDANNQKIVALFVTVNPRPTTKFCEFKVVIDRFLKSKSFEWIILVYEQRGEQLEDMGRGFHVHFLLKMKEYGMSLYDHKRALKRKFKRFLDVNNSSLLNIQPIPAHLIEKKREYLEQPKIDKEKHLKSDYDRLWRIKKDLLDIYRCPNTIPKPITTKPGNAAVTTQPVELVEHGARSAQLINN